MVGEIFAGLSALNAALNSAKALKDINDAAIRNAAIIELQEKILAAREAQSALLDRVRALETEVTDLKTWEAEKKRYDLKEVGPRIFVYALKPETQGTEPPHWICPSCYQKGKKSILQGFKSATFGWVHDCADCKLEIRA